MKSLAQGILKRPFPTAVKSLISSLFRPRKKLGKTQLSIEGHSQVRHPDDMSLQVHIPQNMS